MARGKFARPAWGMVPESDREAVRRGETWTREEHIIAFNLYSQLPFGKLHSTTPEIVRLANLLGRTPGSVAMKLNNFARLDPSLQRRGIRGLQRGARGEVEVWDQFASDPEGLAFEGCRLLADREGSTLEHAAGIDARDLPPSGVEREAMVRLRVNQGFFRRRVLSAYDFTCCVTGLRVRELLVASHIVAWAEDAAQRLNPRNGLCLNALHDRAFDRRLMWIDEDLSVRFSRRLGARTSRKGDAALDWVLAFEGVRLILPHGFSPDPTLLERQRGLANHPG